MLFRKWNPKNIRLSLLKLWSSQILSFARLSQRLHLQALENTPGGGYTQWLRKGSCSLSRIEDPAVMELNWMSWEKVTYNTVAWNKEIHEKCLATHGKNTGLGYHWHYLPPTPKSLPLTMVAMRNGGTEAMENLLIWMKTWVSLMPCPILTVNHSPGLQSLSHWLAGCIPVHFYNPKCKHFHLVSGSILSSILNSFCCLNRLSRGLAPVRVGAPLNPWLTSTENQTVTSWQLGNNCSCSL